jgi:hypothetical protein
VEKFVTFALAIVLCVTCPLGAAAATSSVTVNPLGLLFGVLNAQYEVAFDQKDSFTLGGSFMAWDLDYWELAAGGLEIGTRTYYGGKGPKGFFLHTGVGGALVSATYDDGWGRVDGSGAMATGTFAAGYKWVGRGGFTSEVSGGLNIAMGSVTAGGEKEEIRSASPGVSFSLGYSW